MTTKNQKLIDLEAAAFALWKVDASMSYKRHIMVNLYDLLRNRHNTTDTELFVLLAHRCNNVTRVEFDCALAVLKSFDVVGIYPVATEDDVKLYHVNQKRKGIPAWKKYLKNIGAAQPMAAS